MRSRSKPSRRATKANTATTSSTSRATQCGERIPFEFRPLGIPGLVLIEPKQFGDARGWFMETFKASDFERAGIRREFRQDNHSRTLGLHTVRGLHYQLARSAQGKLVRVAAGRILDVAVDIRRGSPTFGRSAQVELSAENRRILWIPEGFAHGFCTLTEETEVLYRTTAEYDPEAERIIRWDDPDLAIPWPTRAPTLAPKDAEAPYLKQADIDLTWSPDDHG